MEDLILSIVRRAYDSKEGSIKSSELSPWNRVLLGKPTVAQLLKNFSTSYGTRKFITVFTTARY
jgi:hypothetical protein